MTSSGVRRFSLSRIGLRLLAFNLLVVFVPVLGILYLDVYENHLRQAQENAMAQQARILAAAITADPADGRLDGARLARIFDRLDWHVDARLRVYDAQGMLIADSARSTGLASIERSKYGPEPNDTRRMPLYRAGARLANTGSAALESVRRWFRRSPKTPPAAESATTTTDDSIQNGL